jgi:hypothetical protein
MNRLPGRQDGAVLFLSLIMLGVMSLLVTSALRTSLIELRISGASEVVATNVANAEIAINDFIALNDGRFAPGFLTTPVGAGGAIDANITVPAFEGTVERRVIQLGCGDAAGFNSMMGPTGSLQATQFEIEARARLARGGETTVRQGVVTLSPAGTC